MLPYIPFATKEPTQNLTDVRQQFFSKKKYFFSKKTKKNLMSHCTILLHKKKKSWYYIYMSKHETPKQNRLLVKVGSPTSEVAGSRPEKKIFKKFSKNFPNFHLKNN